MKTSKIILPFFLALFFLNIGYGQITHESVFKETGDVGYFFGPIVDVSAIDLDYRFFMGGQAAFTYGDVFLGVFGIGSRTFQVTNSSQTVYDMRIAYGGPWLGYRPFVERSFHPYLGMKFGWGSAIIENGEGNNYLKETDAVFIFQPEIGIEAALQKNIRLIFTGGYKWVNGWSKKELFMPEDLKGMVFSLALQFGRF